MAIDWQAMKEQWVSEVEARLVPRLLGDRRFVGSAKAVANFRNSVEHWRNGKPIRQIINDGNELAAAAALLAGLPSDHILRYEPRLTATRKTIDFKVEAKDGSRGWIDMKTVAPLWKNDKAAWARAMVLRGTSPATAKLVVSREFGGAGIAGQAFNTRFSFAQRALQLEEKIALLTEKERGAARLLFCTAGEWHEDDLEDFADFYRTGRFRSDDWSQTALARFMTKNGIAFAGSISGFCYLKRPHDRVGGCALLRRRARSGVWRVCSARLGDR